MVEWRHVLRPDGVYVMRGPRRLYCSRVRLWGPLISMTGSKKMGVLWWWKPFQREDVAFLTQLIEGGSLRPVIDKTYR